MPGGIIPPDGRNPSPPGVGTTARRHDLEKPKGSVPGLQGSDLQYGDVSMLRQAQRTAPTGSSAKQIQAPAAGAGPSSGRQTAGPQQQNGPAGMSVPDPMEYLGNKLRNTRQGAPNPQRMRAIDPSPFMPLLRRLANSPGSSGTLQNAVITQLSNLARRPYVPDIRLGDIQDLDAGVEAMVNALE